MKSGDMPSLRIGKFEARVPIIQGGMGVHVSLAGLASAVAEEGGIGVISSVGVGELEPDIKTNYSGAHKRALIREIKKARAKTKGLIGVNIMVALTDFEAHIEGAIEAEADIVFLGSALPRKMPLDDLAALHTEFVPIISSGKGAKVILKYWKNKYNYVPNAVVVEGPKAGGHLGFKKEQIFDPAYALENLVPDVIAAVEPFGQAAGKSISVIAAGGVFSGADIYNFLQKGAAGVQMATRFVATVECDAGELFKQAYVNCSEEDIMIITSPLGLPGRAIRSPFLVEVEAGNKMPYKCPWHCLLPCDVVNSPYCIADALVNAKVGNFDKGFAFAGANAWRVDRIMPVKELMQLIKDEYKAAACTEVA